MYLTQYKHRHISSCVIDSEFCIHNRIYCTLVTTGNCNTITNLRTYQITTAHAEPKSVIAFTGRCSVTVPNNRDYSTLGFTSLPPGYHLTTHNCLNRRLSTNLSRSCSLYSLGAARTENGTSNNSSIVMCVSVIAIFVYLAVITQYKGTLQNITAELNGGNTDLHVAAARLEPRVSRGFTKQF
jgi:hypothetical protein